METPQKPKVIFTADDFGLSPEINRGIIDAHVRGSVTSASFLVNAPASMQAVELAKETPTLEVGIHLALVESISMLAANRANEDSNFSITDTLRYLDDKSCLIRSWKSFLPRYALGRINLEEIREELDLQLARFRELFGAVPFANGTQHLHLLPGIAEIVIDLAKKYGVKAVRAGSPMPDLPRVGAPRWLPARVLQALGARFRSLAQAAGILCPDYFWGFPHSGATKPETLIRIVKNLRPGTNEIMLHPGHECAALRRNLPWAYADFNWQSELDAATSNELRDLLNAGHTERINFSSLSALR